MNCDIMKEADNTTNQRSMDCIDVGSENCPCYLALTGDCLICSRLQGKDYCGCNWAGVCVYNEFIQGNKKVNNPRKDFEAKIVRRKIYNENLIVYVLDVGKGFAMKVERPGSYLLARAKGAESFYDIPLSIMKTDVEQGHIYLAIKVISSKTKTLIGENDTLLIRGPYRSGIHGISAIVGNKAKDQKVLIIGKGIGIAPGALISQSIGTRASIDMVIDTEKICKEFIKDFIYPAQGTERVHNEDTEIQYMSLNNKETNNKLETLMQNKNYDSVILLVSDYYIGNLGSLVKMVLPKANLAVSNNFRICCGEGLCGSCSVDTGSGSIKMCKCRLKGEELLNSQ
ncbi:MAG: hypothetical protein PHE79_00985 [Eubacteriales bacterium]|nr:hypothetical protein [Eubacteriales bacterium]